MPVPSEVKHLVQAINDVTKQGARYGCEHKLEIEGMPEVSMQMKSFGLPPMKRTEASEFVEGVEIPTEGVLQFGGNEGIPFIAKVRRKGKTLGELRDQVFSGKWIDKVRVSLQGPGETPTGDEIFDCFKCKFHTDVLSLEDDANTETLTVEGTFYYHYWLPGE